MEATMAEDKYLGSDIFDGAVTDTVAEETGKKLIPEMKERAKD